MRVARGEASKPSLIRMVNIILTQQTATLLLCRFHFHYLFLLVCVDYISSRFTEEVFNIPKLLSQQPNAKLQNLSAGFFIAPIICSCPTLLLCTIKAARKLNSISFRSSGNNCYGPALSFKLRVFSVCWGVFVARSAGHKHCPKAAE